MSAKVAYRALSVLAPAGELVREGRKTLEVRKWRPDGALPLKNLLIVENRVRLSSAGTRADPDGRAVALVDVVAVRSWIADDLRASCSESFEEGWLAWELKNVRRVECSRPVEACLRIYEVEFLRDELVAQEG